MNKHYSSYKEALSHIRNLDKNGGIRARIIKDKDDWIILYSEQHIQESLQASNTIHQTRDNYVSELPKSSEPSSLEMEWKDFLALSRKAKNKQGVSKKKVNREFKKLIEKKNPFALKVVQRRLDKELEGLRSKKEGILVSGAYKKGATYKMTDLYGSGGQVLKRSDSNS